jgi:anti-sigma factor RsiW
MKCRAVGRQLSLYLDGDLASGESRAVALHLEACDACRRRLRQMQAVSEALSDLPRLGPPVSLAVEVRDRLEVESRGPGLALIFRPAWRARPLMLPSLVPAALLLLVALAAAVVLDGGPSAQIVQVALGDAEPELPPVWGTESNPLFPVAGVSVPRSRNGGEIAVDHLSEMSEGTLFVETIVARDGSVSSVHVVEGDPAGAAPLMEALWRERFWPGHMNGRPVAVSFYRLISRMDVRAPLT